MHYPDRVWHRRRNLGDHLSAFVGTRGSDAFVFADAIFTCVYVKQIMAASRAEVQQVIEVPVKSTTRSVFNIGNLIIVGGIGYVLVKTFLLEERVNDLTVRIKRQSGGSSGRPISHVRAVNHQDEYETSDEEDEDVNITPERVHSNGENRDGEEEEEEEVRIEEQPHEVPPPSDNPVRRGVVTHTPGSAFVTTRQRRSGSELRRDSSRGGAIVRET